MLSIQEVIKHIQEKISSYRKIESKFMNVQYKVQSSKVFLQSFTQQFKLSILQIINSYKKDFFTQIVEISLYYQNQIKKIKKQCQLEVQDINKDRERQYNCIRKMKEEIFSLQELMNLRNLSESKQSCYEKQNQNYGLQTNNQDYPREEQTENRTNNKTINGLEVIAEEETERTIVSSVRSFNQEFRYPDNFIKIEEKQSGEFEQYEKQNKIQRECLQDNNKNVQHQHFNYELGSNEYQFVKQKSLSKSQTSSIKKLQKLLADSNIENRQNTHQYQLISQQSTGQYESLPLSVDGYESRQFNREDFHLWNAKKGGKQLRDITNEGHENDRSEIEKERQQKTKMFLQQFRKTFSKCLSSANVSRKTSSKVQRSSKNNTSRQQKNNKTLKDIGGYLAKDIDRIQNQKIINQMLKDIDNNNKFIVGNRKIQFKYQGERKDGTRNGKGILYYTNGLCYQGQFKNNMRHGSGILRFNLVQLYRGQWQNDQLSGQGRLRNFAVINNKRNQSGNNSPLQKWGSYYGFFKNNRFEGEGTLYLSGGQKFLGKFICGMACGEGILYKQLYIYDRKSGEVQNGIWRNNQLVERF